MISPAFTIASGKSSSAALINIFRALTVSFVNPADPSKFITPNPFKLAGSP